MTANLIPIYGCAVLTITVLCLFARQNQKSGWTRLRTETVAEGLLAFYQDLGIATEEQAAPPELKPLTAEDAIGFSAQLLKLQSALGVSSPVTQDSPIRERELVHQ